MECSEVREQFSSLREGDLNPPEDERAREHLRSCDGCRKEWEQFNRMMGRLHEFEEEEVPEGFLSEIQKKREERKGQESRGWVWSLRSMKVPIQAAAMVMIVFFALYLTKMAPFEILERRTVAKHEVLQSDEEKKEQRSSPVTEGVTKAEPSLTQEMAKAEPPYQEEKKREQESGERIIMAHPQKAFREITLKASDREKTIFQIRNLAKKMGGEAVKEDGDILIASLPVSSYVEFEKELAKISLPLATPRAIVEQERKDELRLAARVKSRESEEKGKEPSRSLVPREDTVSIRIRLVME